MQSAKFYELLTQTYKIWVYSCVVFVQSMFNVMENLWGRLQLPKVGEIMFQNIRKQIKIYLYNNGKLPKIFIF